MSYHSLLKYVVDHWDVWTWKGPSWPRLVSSPSMTLCAPPIYYSVIRILSRQVLTNERGCTHCCSCLQGAQMATTCDSFSFLLAFLLGLSCLLRSDISWHLASRLHGTQRSRSSCPDPFFHSIKEFSDSCEYLLSCVVFAKALSFPAHLRFYQLQLMLE